MNQTRVRQRASTAPDTGQRYFDLGHLLRRSGFGATPQEITAAAQAGTAATIDRIVNYSQIPDNFTPPDPTVIAGKNTPIEPLSVWWLQRMLTTARPFQEKMTLFWHGHFATAFSKVRYPSFMYQQNQLFRQTALGRFDDILGAVYKDPAMLIWLDGDRNVKAAPNENFAREVMELFTIGRGPDSAPNYTQNDVHEGARSFTGWQLNVDTGAVVFNPRLHDDGMKSYLGQTGNFTGDDIVRILAAHPATGSFLATKIWRFFASETAPVGVIQSMSQSYYSSGHSIAAMVRTMFTSPELYSQDTRQSHIKNPTDFAVSALHHLGLSNVDLTAVPRTLALMGQELFNPPNVGGWSGGASWVNAATMLTRFNFASRVTGDAPGSQPLFDPTAMYTASQAASATELVDYVTNLLGVIPGATTGSALLSYAGGDAIQRFISRLMPADDVGLQSDPATTVRGLVHLTLTSPEYQIA